MSTRATKSEARFQEVTRPPALHSATAKLMPDTGPGAHAPGTLRISDAAAAVQPR